MLGLDAIQLGGVLGLVLQFGGILGLDEGKFISPRGHRHKLERTLEVL